MRTEKKSRHGAAMPTTAMCRTHVSRLVLGCVTCIDSKQNGGSQRRLMPPGTCLKCMLLRPSCSLGLHSQTYAHAGFASISKHVKSKTSAPAAFKTSRDAKLGKDHLDDGGREYCKHELEMQHMIRRSVKSAHPTQVLLMVT